MKKENKQRKAPQEKKTREKEQIKNLAHPREVALEILNRVIIEKAYSTLTLHQVLKKTSLAPLDVGLTTELVYGTLQRLNTIDAVLKERVKGWPLKIDSWVQNLLRLSYYQLRWLCRIPAHAVVHEAVEIAKKRGHAGIFALVNGVLRNLLRDSLATSLPVSLSKADKIALTYSHPLWLIKRWLSQYGEIVTKEICTANNDSPFLTARVNLHCTTRESVLSGLKMEGIEAEPSLFMPSGIVLPKFSNLTKTHFYREGKLTIQDESAMLVAAVADPKPGMTVVDCCAAPGGKATHLAELMHDQGIVYANDVHPHKKDLIHKQAERLHLTSIQTIVEDASNLKTVLGENSCDIVLLDAPCSGFGVIRRKPEIKWRKRATDVEQLAHLQSQLLRATSRLVKPGGVLVYSTCTLMAEENETQIQSFLLEHPQFSLDVHWPDQILQPFRKIGVISFLFEGMLEIRPSMFGSDGFFVARLRRKME